jgi:hypothetical protein
MRAQEFVTENKQATAREVLDYINRTHHEPLTLKLEKTVLSHPQWQLQQVPLLNLNIPDEEYDDVEQEPESDPYGRVMAVDPGYAGEVSQNLIDKRPIVIDADRYIIDGNHRAWAAKYLLNRDYIQAWMPVEQIAEITRRDFLRGAGAMAGTAAIGQPVQAQTPEDVEDILTSAANLYAILVKHFRQDPRTNALGAIFKSMSFSLKYREKFREEYEQATLGLDLLQKKPNEYKKYVQKFLANYEKIKRDLESLQDLLTELNYPDELNVSDALQQYFVRRGYQVAGEGRDQIAFESPRGTVVKVLGIGEQEREDIVKRYVKFFLQHQRNPYYPRIYNTGNFTVGDETYFVYEMEYLNYIADEEEVLEYIEDLMSAAARGPEAVRAYQQNRPLPRSLPEDEIQGLLQATYELESAIGGQAPLDLSMIENIRRRANGHIVIMDPYSL